MNTDWSSVGTAQAVQCLRLHLVQGVGPLRFRNLIEHFSSVEAIKLRKRSGDPRKAR